MVPVAFAAVLGVALGAGAVAWADRPDAAPATAPATQSGADPARVAELEAAEAARAAESLDALAAFGADLQDELAPVLTGLDAALPQDGAPRVVPTAGEVDGWRAVVDGLAARAAALPSGGTEHNLTRNGLELTLALLGDATDHVARPRTADPGAARDLYRSAATARERAFAAFAPATMQLDLLSVEAGKGHLHLRLPAGSSASGADPHGH